MKNNIHDVESRSHTAQHNYVPGTSVVKQCNPHSSINLLLWGARVGCFALLFLFFLMPETGTASSKPVAQLSVSKISAFIVMEADIIRADTEDEGIDITELKVYDSSLNLVYHKNDCNSSTCEIYAGNWNTGMYLVVAVTSNSRTFSDYVFKN